MISCNESHREIVYDDKEYDRKGILKECPLCAAIRVRKTSMSPREFEYFTEQVIETND